MALLSLLWVNHSAAASCRSETKISLVLKNNKGPTEESIFENSRQRKMLAILHLKKTKQFLTEF